MSSKHILIISQYFNPEQFRINDIAEEWVKRGYKVTVITGIPNYPEGKYFPGYGLIKKRKEVVNGVNIIRIPLVPRGKSSIMLGLNYVSFVVSGFFWKLLTRIKADYVFIFGVSPLTQALPGIWYAKKKNIPAYLYVQDLWPDNVQIVTGIKNNRIISILNRMMNYIYRNTDEIFTTSKSFIESLMHRGVNQDKLHYWPQYAEEVYVAADGHDISDKLGSELNIMFTGNIGAAQGLNILPESALILKQKNINSWKFTIVGDGRFKEKLVKLIRDLDVEEYFDFIPLQPPSKIPALLKSADIALLSLSNDILLEQTIPAKLQSYMACGIAVLASASGESKQIVEQSKCGYVCAPGDARALADVIIEILSMDKGTLVDMGINAKRYAVEHFSKEKLLTEFDNYLL